MGHCWSPKAVSPFAFRFSEKKKKKKTTMKLPPKSRVKPGGNFVISRRLLNTIRLKKMAAKRAPRVLTGENSVLVAPSLRRDFLRRTTTESAATVSEEAPLAKNRSPVCTSVHG